MRKLAVITMMFVFVALSAYAQTNKVLNLDGDGDYVLVGKSDTFQITTLTVETWLNVFEYGSTILWNGDTVGGWDPFWLHISDDGKLHLRLCILGGDVYLQSKIEVQPSNWCHVAFAIDDSSKTASLYLDGILEDFRTFTGSSVAEYNHLAFGAYADGGGTGFFTVGLIDEIRIWNIARPQEQIQATMNATLSGTEAGLVAYWNFDSGTANDLTANENDGTLFGDAKIVDQFYVSPSGNDANDGSKGNPFATIQHAIDQVGHYDIITVLPGTYEGNITLVGDLTLQGNPGADGTIITASSGNVVTANNVHNVTLTGFTIDGQGTADNGILCSGSTSEMEIRNNTITNSTRGIYCTDSANSTIEKNTICQNIEDGIYCIGSSESTIAGNKIKENGRSGIWCHNNASIKVSNNQINYNGSIGIVCSGQSNITIDNNIVAKNQGGFSFYDSAIVSIENNCVKNNNYSGIFCCDDVTATVDNNLVAYNGWAGIHLAGSADAVISRNIIANNYNEGICYDGETDIVIGGDITQANTFDISDHGWCLISNRTDNTINATYNYWGTDDESEIENMMHNEGEGLIKFKPFIGSPELIGDASGNGEITAYDASLILQYVVGLIDQFPANISSIGGNVTPRNRTISIPNLSVKSNQLLSVPIIIDETSDLVAGGITIKYDPTVLQATGIKVTPVSLLNNAYWRSNINNDEIKIAFTKVDWTEVNESEVIAILEFESVGNVEGMTTDLVIDHAQIAESLSITKVDGHITFLPSNTMLLQNYPNPFNPETWIPFQLSDDADVVISIYDVGGQLIRKIGLGDMPAGVYVNQDKAVFWNGCNNTGEKVASGVYFYTLQASSYSATKRMLILK